MCASTLGCRQHVDDLAARVWERQRLCRGERVLSVTMTDYLAAVHQLRQATVQGAFGPTQTPAQITWRRRAAGAADVVEYR